MEILKRNEKNNLITVITNRKQSLSYVVSKIAISTFHFQWLPYVAPTKHQEAYSFG